MQKRTQIQNDSLHLWIRQLSERYMELGLTLDELLDNFTIEIYPTEQAVKEVIIKTIIDKMFGKKSTTQLLKQGEIDKLVDVVTKFNAKVNPDIGYIPFPAVENQFNELGK